MPATLYRLRAPLLGAAVLATLGFGASSALASARPCPESSIGSCPNQARCQDSCTSIGGNAANANCRDGCCYCPLVLP